MRSSPAPHICQGQDRSCHAAFNLHLLLNLYQRVMPTPGAFFTICFALRTQCLLVAHNHPHTHPLILAANHAVMGWGVMQGSSATGATAASTDNEHPAPAAQQPSNRLLHFLHGSSIFITGATGFLAKVLVEKVLRVQPDVGSIYLLIKPKQGSTAQQRLQQMLQLPVFDVLRQMHGPGFDAFIAAKLMAVEGDITEEDLGLQVRW